jgi:hypothetical protein
VPASRTSLLAGIAAALAGVVAWLVFSHDATRAVLTDPDDGKVANGRFISAYFDVVYPLPPGWGEGLAGPGPSESGYYVLKTLQTQGELTGTILIAAQDQFFFSKAFESTAAMAEDFTHATAEIEGMTIDREPNEARLGGRLFRRVDFSGVGLYRAMFVTDIRCHFVSFTLTTQSTESLASLAESLDRLSFVGASQASHPVCIKDYTVAANVERRVEPAAIGSRFVPIPVRVIIGADGGVKHIHVVHAETMQRRSIEDALRQWRFKPHVVDGRPVEVETGLVFRFGAARREP